MKLFFEICKEFFDLLYLPYVSDIIENDIISEDVDDEFDEEKGYREVEHIQEEKEEEDYENIQEKQLIPDIQYRQDIQYSEEKQDIEENIQEDDEVFCSCEFFRQIVSIINARIYKQLNDNKSD